MLLQFFLYRSSRQGKGHGDLQIEVRAWEHVSQATVRPGDVMHVEVPKRTKKDGAVIARVVMFGRLTEVFLLPCSLLQCYGMHVISGGPMNRLISGALAWGLFRNFAGHDVHFLSSIISLSTQDESNTIFHRPFSSLSALSEFEQKVLHRLVYADSITVIIACEYVEVA